MSSLPDRRHQSSNTRQQQKEGLHLPHIQRGVLCSEVSEEEVPQNQWQQGDLDPSVVVGSLRSCDRATNVLKTCRSATDIFSTCLVK